MLPLASGPLLLLLEPTPVTLLAPGQLLFSAEGQGRPRCLVHRTQGEGIAWASADFPLLPPPQRKGLRPARCAQGPPPAVSPEVFPTDLCPESSGGSLCLSGTVRQDLF